MWFVDCEEEELEGGGGGGGGGEANFTLENVYTKLGMKGWVPVQELK